MSKIPAEIVAKMGERIEPLDTEELRAKYRAREIVRAEAVKDIDVRYRWDLYYAARAYEAFPVDYDYMGSHVDTALRKLVPAL